MMGRYILAWVPMVAIAIANGILRDMTYGKSLGALRGHQISTITLLLLFAFYIGTLNAVWPLASEAQALSVGAVWVGLTLIFEFSFGHYVAKHSWQELLGDYNLLAGRLWLLIPLWVATAPWLFYRLSS